MTSSITWAHVAHGGVACQQQSQAHKPLRVLQTTMAFLPQLEPQHKPTFAVSEGQFLPLAVVASMINTLMDSSESWIVGHGLL